MLLPSLARWQNVSTFTSLKMRNKHFHLFPKYQFDNEIKSAIHVFFIRMKSIRTLTKSMPSILRAWACAYACVQMIFNFFMLNGSRRQKCTQMLRKLWKIMSGERCKMKYKSIAVSICNKLIFMWLQWHAMAKMNCGKSTWKLKLFFPAFWKWQKRGGDE